jgi:hypothetical protein
LNKNTVGSIKIGYNIKRNGRRRKKKEEEKNRPLFIPG